MVLRVKSKVVQSPNSRTQFITIPSIMVTDSQYPFKSNEEVEIVIHTREHKLEVIQLKQSAEEIKTKVGTAAR
jgi:hypothetical protein